MIISYEPILTKIALPEIPGIKKNENATKHYFGDNFKCIIFE